MGVAAGGLGGGALSGGFPADGGEFPGQLRDPFLGAGQRGGRLFEGFPSFVGGAASLVALGLNAAALRDDAVAVGLGLCERALRFGESGFGGGARAESRLDLGREQVFGSDGQGGEGVGEFGEARDAQFDRVRLVR